jgi:hypothetical protein
MNYCVRPSLLCPPHLKIRLAIISTIPVSIATSGAAWISVTSPTYGFGCRSIHQLSFLLTWIISAVLTVYFRRNFHGRKQLTLTRIKDVILGLGMATTFGMGFIGWFNSCFCWSSWFSNYKNPYVVRVPDEIIKKLARSTWPALCFSAVGLQLLFIIAMFVWFRKGAMLYLMSDEEHEAWHDEKLVPQDPEREEEEGTRRGRMFSEDFSFSESRSPLAWSRASVWGEENMEPGRTPYRNLRGSRSSVQ